MKRRCLILLLIGTLCLSGCASRQRKEIEMFNTGTEGTIQLYDATKAQFEGHEDEFVKGLIEGTINTDWLSEDLDYSGYSKMITEHSNPLIADDILVKSSDFYTALNLNSVTQILIFGYRGTDYIAEILWVDCKIDMMNVEII